MYTRSFYSLFENTFKKCQNILKVITIVRKSLDLPFQILLQLDVFKIKAKNDFQILLKMG